MKKISVFAFAVVFLLMGAVQINATTIYLVGVNDPNNTATVEFEYSWYLDSELNDDYLGKIDVGITNTSMYEAVITGFTFNAHTKVTSLESFEGPDGWTGYFDTDNISTPEPFGFFDVAGITGKNLEGGNPKEGIEVDDTYKFTFIFNGIDLETLTAESFLNELSFIKVQGNESGVSIAARVQRSRFDGESSDVMIPRFGDRTPIPEPATMVFFGTGLLFCAGMCRRKYF